MFVQTDLLRVFFIIAKIRNYNFSVLIALNFQMARGIGYRRGNYGVRLLLIQMVFNSIHKVGKLERFGNKGLCVAIEDTFPHFCIC